MRTRERSFMNILINDVDSNEKEMNQEETDTRQRIIDAASKVFLEQGYARATTRKIAAAANLTEVTLFRHFGTKENLFAAAFEQFGAVSDLEHKLQEQLTGDYRHDMRCMGFIFMDFIKAKGEVIRLSMCEAKHFPQVRNSVAKAPRELRRILAEYLQQQMEKGAIRNLHPELVANGFWGVFLYNYLFRLILDEPSIPDLSDTEIINQIVDMFVDGTIK